MISSNVIVYSNTFLSEKGDPRCDRNFVSQIVDYDKLKQVLARKQVNPAIAPLTREQEQIVETGLRCVYAKNDPCFGFTNRMKTVGCLCINQGCPIHYLNKCNPWFTRADAQFWRPRKEDIELYGDPKTLRRYYLVDIIPDEEMMRYYPDPENVGIDHPLLRTHKVIPDEPKNEDQKTKIDPITGRKMIIVGYEWKLEKGDPTYHEEHLLPIWDFVDEEDTYVPVIQSSEIQSETDNEVVEDHVETALSDVASVVDYFEVVKRSIIDQKSISELDKMFQQGKRYVILVDNPAERGLISSDLMKAKIEHGYSRESMVQILLCDEFAPDLNADVLILSKSLLTGVDSDRYETQWEELSKKGNLVQLNIPSHMYYQLENKNEDSRWCIKNVYGVTHLCVTGNDIESISIEKDGVYPIRLSEEKKGYAIMMNGEKLIGYTNEKFSELINELVRSGDLAEKPAYIEKLAIEKDKDRVGILGIGKPIFLEEY